MPNSNYDVVSNNVGTMAVFIMSSADNGKFPQGGIVSRYKRGGDIFCAVDGFLRQCSGRGIVYFACDSHKKIYSVSLLKMRNSCGEIKGRVAPANWIIENNGGGIDEFCLRIWSRKSVGGLYRRAKTRYRCRKYTPSNELLDSLARLAQEAQEDAEEAAEDAEATAVMAEIDPGAADAYQKPGMVQL